MRSGVFANSRWGRYHSSLGVSDSHKDHRDGFGVGITRCTTSSRGGWESQILQLCEAQGNLGAIARVGALIK